MSYIGGYRGSPAANLLEAADGARTERTKLGAHFQSYSKKATAGAVLGASVAYPLQGAG